jgi:CheY-like chemotaxis protein
MTYEVRCPGCGDGWILEDVGAGEMICPACMARIPLATATPVAAAAREVAAHGPAAGNPPFVEEFVLDLTALEEPVAPAARPAGPSARPGPAAPTASTAAPARSGSPAATSVTAATPRPSPAAAVQVPLAGAPASTSSRDSEIVCPRCNFHFQTGDRPAPVHDTSRKTVLVVDDLAYFRKIAFDALSPTFDVKTAATGAEALELLDQGGIDLMVLDLTLGGREGGREGGRRLLTGLRPKPCPILIYTAQDESEMYGESWEELSRLGADDVVIKGMNVAGLLVRKVGSLLGTPIDEEGVLR